MLGRTTGVPGQAGNCGVTIPRPLERNWKVECACCKGEIAIEHGLPRHKKLPTKNGGLNFR